MEAKDKDGQDIVTGVQIQDTEDGTYKISYFLREAGELRASVKVIQLQEINILIRNDLEIHETLRSMSDRNRRFGAFCAIIKVT